MGFVAPVVVLRLVGLVLLVALVVGQLLQVVPAVVGQLLQVIPAVALPVLQLVRPLGPPPLPSWRSLVSGVGSFVPPGLPAPFVPPNFYRIGWPACSVRYF